MLSSHPSPAQSPWFPLPIDWLHLQYSWLRHRLIESASGLYQHLWWLLSATRRHHNTFQVLNCGQWLITGFPTLGTLHKHWKCWLYHEGWCNAAAEVRRVCWRFWRLNVGCSIRQHHLRFYSALSQFAYHHPSTLIQWLNTYIHYKDNCNHALQLYVTHLYLP